MAAAFFAGAFFAAVFLAAAFFAESLLGRSLLLDRAARTTISQQLRCTSIGNGFDVVVLTKAGVGLAVGDVRTETAVLDHHRLLADRIDAQLTQRRRCRRLTPTTLRLGVDLERLVERDGEHLLSLASERESVPFFRYGP